MYCMLDIHVCVQVPRSRRDCCICNTTGQSGNLSVWVTHGDENAPCNPCFWCDECYHQMHYDDKHNLLYTGFDAFPYQYEHGMMKQVFKGEMSEECNEDG